MAKRFENSLKLIIPGMYFEELGLDYIGPVDGHNLEDLISALKTAKSARKPVVVHAQTIKGKGYDKAEGYLESWHGVGPFDIQSGEFKKKSAAKSATQIYAEALLSLAAKHENVVGVTAAMPSGTGMDKLIEKFPQRFWDVAIAEPHALSSMAAMAREGFKPYVTIYSTFMQRAFDQIVHDAAIMNLSLVLAMDRAGIVGEDGETHEGVFDVSFLNAIPNVSMCAPRDEASFKRIIEYSYAHEGVLAIRYPRGSFILDCDETGASAVEFAKSVFLKRSDSARVALIGYGNGAGRAYKTAAALEGQMEADVVDLVFAKPLDGEFLRSLARKDKIWYVFSDNAKKGGVGEILSAFLQENEISDVKIVSFEFADIFLPHGKTADVERSLGLDIQTLTERILSDKKY